MSPGESGATWGPGDHPLALKQKSRLPKSWEGGFFYSERIR